MKLTVLVDNNTLIDQYYYGEPGVSYFVEDKGCRLLFDVGYSNAFINNAKKLNINLCDLDFIIFSHGHNDHTWGIGHLIEMHKTKEEDSFRTTLVAHPLAILPKFHNNEDIGCTISERELAKYFNLRLSEEPYWLNERVVFLGQIERSNKVEVGKPIGKVVRASFKEDDYLLDDTALVLKTIGGLVIITGCSHTGICNIVEYAKKVCEDDRIHDIIGGFHLINPSDEQLKFTMQYMKTTKPRQVHACHCTDLDSKLALSQVVKLKEVGVGLTIDYD